VDQNKEEEINTSPSLESQEGGGEKKVREKEKRSGSVERRGKRR
jgi:hypothetical protein